MKEYKVTVDGTEYHVAVEKVNGTYKVQANEKAQKPAEAPAAKTEKIAENPKAAPKSGNPNIAAPMPGKVLDIKVAAGDKVSAGDVVVLLEAMKMEIEVSADMSGTVKSIEAAKGSTVNTGDILVVLE